MNELKIKNNSKSQENIIIYNPTENSIKHEYTLKPNEAHEFKIKGSICTIKINNDDEGEWWNGMIPLGIKDTIIIDSKKKQVKTETDTFVNLVNIKTSQDYDIYLEFILLGIIFVILSIILYKKYKK